MIVLVQPMYSKQELNADSNYVVYSSLIRGFHEAKLPHHFLVLFPDAKSGYSYERDGFFSLPNVTRIPQRISPRKMANAVAYDPIYYDRLLRTVGVDVIWCNLVEIACQLKHAGESTYEDVGRPAVIAAHNYNIHRSLPYPIESMEHVLWQQLVGFATADYNTFLTEHCRSMFMEEALDRLGPGACAQGEARSMVLNYGVLGPELNPEPREDNEVPVIAYNHRLQGYKRWRDTMSVLQELWDEGLRFKLRYMNNTGEKLSQIRSYPFVEVRLTSNRKDYLQALRGCDLNVTNAQYETFCISAIESMALGQPLIAPQGVTFPEITGQPITGYPHLFSSREEQLASLRLFLTSKADRELWGGCLSGYVHKAFSRPLWVERYSNLFAELTEERVPSIKDQLAHEIKVCLAKNSGKTTREFYSALTKIRVGGKQPVSNQSFPLTKVIRVVRHVGGSVRMIKGEQRVYA